MNKNKKKETDQQMIERIVSDYMKRNGLEKEMSWWEKLTDPNYISHDGSDLDISY